ncbi:hypothetical protein C5Y96_10600 [Blastopirellula marina]|uniref:Uncharacterized protein n=2 Tax=Pirellulales TaxID=2691354 RepID=A0A2S8FM76_9BACT|nr:hypothetical protein C5Y96_10600 [Blastopirellula marina]RCS52381.1 hypothetical protein DTL36_10610 [Bremerella cremea]
MGGVGLRDWFQAEFAVGEEMGTIPWYERGVRRILRRLVPKELYSSTFLAGVQVLPGLLFLIPIFARQQFDLRI